MLIHGYPYADGLASGLCGSQAKVYLVGMKQIFNTNCKSEQNIQHNNTLNTLNKVVMHFRVL